VGVDTVLEYLADHRESARHITKQIDSMYILDLGAAVNCRLVPPSALSPNLTPCAESIPVVIQERALMSFMALFSQYYNQAEIGANFDFTQYIAFPNRMIPSTTTQRTVDIVLRAQADGWNGFAPRSGTTAS
jgi:hypothetical protein